MEDLPPIVQAKLVLILLLLLYREMRIYEITDENAFLKYQMTNFIPGGRKRMLLIVD